MFLLASLLLERCNLIQTSLDLPQILKKHEHLKYLRNGYCVMTNRSKDQDTRTGHKTTN